MNLIDKQINSLKPTACVVGLLSAVSCMLLDCCRRIQTTSRVSSGSNVTYNKE